MARPTISRKPRIIDGFSEKQSAALFALFARNDDTLQQLAQLDASARIFTTDTVARAGQFLRASPPDSRGMALLLPSPDSTQPGDTISVSLEGPLGGLRVSCVPNQGNGARVTLGTVNGQERATFTTAGLIVFTSNGATGWTTAAEHPAESAAAPSIIPASSVEILPSNPSGSIWTWALRPFSVALGRLAKQVGLSVIGTASDALAGLDAITATAARQALLVNSTGTAIGWRALEGADLPATSPYGWDDVLAADATSNGHNPVVSVGDFLQLGAVGPTTSSPQIRSGDVTFRIHGSNFVEVAATGTSSGQMRITGAATGTNVAHTWVLGGVARLTVLGNGEWSTPAGATNQYWKWQSGAFPTWSSLALSDLPSQASDTFLGNVSGSAGTPTAVNLSTLAGAGLNFAAHTLDVNGSTSITVTSDQVQRSALTGAITANQNSNTTAFGAAAAKSVLANATNVSAVPAFLGGTATFQYLRVNSGNTGLEWATLSTHESTSIVYDAPSNQFQRAAITGVVEVGANLNTSTFGTSIISVPLVETALSGPSVSAGGGAYWVRNTTPNRPVFKDDTGGNWNLFPNTCAANTAPVAVSAGTGTATGASFSAPANTWAVGTCYKVEGFLLFTRGATATALNVVVELSFGGTVFATATIPTFTIAGTGGALINGWLLCLSTGASATFLANIKTLGDMENLSAAPTNGQVWSAATGSGNVSAFGTTKNTGSANTIALQAHMDATVAGTTITWAHAHIFRYAQTAN